MRRPACQASPDITADRLGQYFIDKVDVVRAETKDAPPPTYTRHDGQQLCSFRVLSVDDVRRVVMRSPVKSCILDPLPTFILRDVIDEILPFICVMCNVCLQDGCLPSSQKKALVTPALKKGQSWPRYVEELSSDLKLEFYVENDWAVGSRAADWTSEWV